MKRLLLACIIMMFFGCATTPVFAMIGNSGTDTYADVFIPDITVPEQCKGKEISCGEWGGFCYAVHCPVTSYYDDKGRLIKTEKACEPCHFSRACRCGDYEWRDGR